MENENGQHTDPIPDEAFVQLRAAEAGKPAAVRFLTSSSFWGQF